MWYRRCFDCTEALPRCRALSRPDTKQATTKQTLQPITQGLTWRVIDMPERANGIWSQANNKHFTEAEGWQAGIVPTCNLVCPPPPPLMQHLGYC